MGSHDADGSDGWLQNQPLGDLLLGDQKPTGDPTGGGGWGGGINSKYFYWYQTIPFYMSGMHIPLATGYAFHKVPSSGLTGLPVSRSLV